MKQQPFFSFLVVGMSIGQPPQGWLSILGAYATELGWVPYIYLYIYIYVYIYMANNSHKFIFSPVLK